MSGLSGFNNKSYSVNRIVNSGGFANIYSGKDKHGNHIVVKAEPCNDENTIRTESNVYDSLKDADGFCIKYYTGRWKGNNVIVLNRLGPSLMALSKKWTSGFSSATVAMVALQVLDRLEHLHDLGYIHRDIKPDNILVGEYGQRNQTTIYLVDFGNACTYKDDKMNHVRDGSASECVAGTLLFAPIRWHKQQIQSRRDDLESLCYTMVFLRRRDLPWNCIKRAWTHEAARNFIGFKKESCIPRELFRNMPWQLFRIFQYVRRLSFDERPNYHYLRKLLRSMLTNYGMFDERKFDWMSTCFAKLRNDLSFRRRSMQEL